jgi:S-adenosylmethionine:diacylglycerol 3-amino-3-carboxypropyl transferase
MTLKFNEFQTEITEPVITFDPTKVVDNTIEKELSLSINLATDKAKMYGVFIDGIKYSDTWDDSDLMELLMVRLKDFEL